MNYVLKLDINTELIKTVVPVYVMLNSKNGDILLEGVRCYNIDNYIKLTSGMNRVYDYLTLVILEWRTYLKNNYRSFLEKNDPIINVIEKDINDFIVVFFEAMKEISRDKNDVSISIPSYPINYFRIKLGNNGMIAYTYTQPDNPKEYYIKRLEEMNKHRLTAMKKSILRTFT